VFQGNFHSLLIPFFVEAWFEVGRCTTLCLIIIIIIIIVIDKFIIVTNSSSSVVLYIIQNLQVQKNVKIENKKIVRKEFRPVKLNTKSLTMNFFKKIKFLRYESLFLKISF